MRNITLQYYYSYNIVNSDLSDRTKVERLDFSQNNIICIRFPTPDLRLRCLRNTYTRTHTFSRYKSDRRSLFSNDCHSQSREIARLTLVVCSLVPIINLRRKGRFVLLLNKRTKPCPPPLPRSACWWRSSSYCWSAPSKPPILRVKGNRSPTQHKSRAKKVCTYTYRTKFDVTTSWFLRFYFELFYRRLNE